MNETQSNFATKVLLMAGLLVFLFSSGLFQVSDCDVGYHLRTAAHILARQGVPTINTFSSSTPEHPWLLHQWIGTLIFYIPFALGGVTWLIVFKALVAMLVMWFAWLRARSLTPPQSLASFWIITAGAVVARVRFFERPDLLSALFFSMLLFFDQKSGKNPRWQWLWLPLFMAIWANIHAGVIYGFALLAVLIGADWLEWLIHLRTDSYRQCHSGASSLVFGRPVGFMLSVLSAAATVQLLNPNGWRVLWFPISQFSSKFWQSIIVEYQPPTWAADKSFYLFLGGLVLLQALTIRQVQRRLLLVSAAFGYLACSSQRSLLFFVIAAAPQGAVMLELLKDSIRERWTTKKANRAGEDFAAALQSPAGTNTSSVSPIWHGWKSQAVALPVMWLLLVLTLFVPNRSFRFGTGWYHPYYPLEVYDLLAAEVPSQGVFNEMRYGGSMLWWLYPKFKPFVDGRGDAYSEEFWLREYLPCLDARPGWKATFAKYDLHCALLPLSQTGESLPLVRTLLADRDWAVVAFNDEAVLFLERTKPNLSEIARREFTVFRPGTWSFEWADDATKRQQAQIEINRAMAFTPGSRFARTAKARLALTSGQFEAAAVELRSLVHDFPEAGATYWRDFGYVLCRLGQFDEADKVFSSMIKRKQLAGYACFMEYHIARERRNAAQAERYLARAVYLEPNNPEYSLAYKNLAQAATYRP